MSRWLAIAAYQCRIDGTPTGSVDIQVRYFNLPASLEVESSLRSEPSLSYKNSDDETVAWSLVKILAIQALTTIESGDELIGFITNREELSMLAPPTDAIE